MVTVSLYYNNFFVNPLCFNRYHRGQTVQVEGKKARFAGVISAIGTEAVMLVKLCIKKN